MINLDTIYRAFLEYRKETADDRDCAMQRRDIVKSDAGKADIEIVRVVCNIENDWIEAIETGLDFVERSLAEERQFIRADGEIVPIEKVKRVSRDSVEHLSRHSNLITKKSKDGDLIPEQIYTVERLNDYAVYENRFLYMLLVYLNEFIGMRYTRILELTNTYHGRIDFEKNVSSRESSITFDFELDDTRRNDPIMELLNPNYKTIDKISMLLKTVNHFLSTPLMEEVGKTPQLKPPITKTNVLKMDKNFKGAVKLYEFITAYDRDGYTVETEVKRVTLSDDAMDEFAEIYSISSFLTYEYGMGIKDILKRNYEKEEERRNAVREQQRLDKLRMLRRRVDEEGGDPYEYMAALEKQLKFFDGIYVKLGDALADAERLSDENKALAEQLAKSEAECEENKTEIARLTQKNIDDIAALNAEHDAAVAELKSGFYSEISELNKAHAEELSKADERRVAELAEQKTECDKTVADMKNECADKIAKKDADMARIAQCREDERREQRAVVAERDRRIEQLKAEYAALEEKKSFVSARLNALRHSQGLMTEQDDFTTQAAFDEIEMEYNAFRKFFKGEWKKAKKRIREEVLRAQKTYEGVSVDDIPGMAKDDVSNDTDEPRNNDTVESEPIVEVVAEAVAESVDGTESGEGGDA